MQEQARHLTGSVVCHDEALGRIRHTARHLTADFTQRESCEDRDRRRLLGNSWRGGGVSSLFNVVLKHGMFASPQAAQQQGLLDRPLSVSPKTSIRPVSRHVRRVTYSCRSLESSSPRSQECPRRVTCGIIGTQVCCLFLKRAGLGSL